MAISSSSAHSSFSSRDSSSLSPHTTGSTEDSQDTPTGIDPAVTTSSAQKRSKSLSEYAGENIPSSISVVSSALPTSFGYTTDSQVNTTSGVYSSPQRQRLYSAPNIKGMQPLSHAPSMMMSTKPSPTMNHFALPRAYGQMSQPPPYGHYQSYPSYTPYSPGGNYQTQTPFSPTYSNYSSGSVPGSPYLMHPGPPGSTLYTVNHAARTPTYQTQQPNMSNSYFTYPTSSTLPTASTGAMTTQSNYSTTAGYPPSFTSSSGNTTMYSQPPTATTSMNMVTEPQQNILQSAMSLPTPPSSSSVCDVAALDLPCSLATTAGELDTSHDSVASDSSFPVVSLPSSGQHTTNISDLDTQGRSPQAEGGSASSETSESILSSEASSNPDGALKAALNGTVDKTQLYTKRSVKLKGHFSVEICS